MAGILDSLKDIGNKAKQEVRGVKRAVQDAVSLPSTMEQVERAVSDFWSDEIKPNFNKLKGEVKKEFEAIGKSFDEFKKDPQRFTQEAWQEVRDGIKNFTKSPVIGKLKDFLNSAVELVKSITKSPEDRSKAWENFKGAASALKDAVLGKDKSQGHNR